MSDTGTVIITVPTEPVSVINLQAPSSGEVGVYVGERGPQGDPGPPGPQGVSGGSYLHEQIVPASVWTVVHNLGYFPNVTVIDSAGTQVEPHPEYIDVNSLTMDFGVAFSGKAYCS